MTASSSHSPAANTGSMTWTWHSLRPAPPDGYGTCNDAYSAIRVASALAEAFGCSVNDLPLTLVLSWYEQKAVCILLSLLHLGIKNIYLGPTLPAFLSENVLGYLVEQFQISPTGTPEEDLKKMLGK